MVKQKRVKFLTISLLIVLTMSCFFTVFVGVFKRMLQNDSDVKAATWNFDNGAVGTDEYADHYAGKESAYSEFTIGSLSALKNFATSMAGSFGSCKFSGKTIKLTANIDCGESDIVFGWESVTGGSSAEVNNCTFQGTFNGQGYTISNITKSIGMYDAGDYAGIFVRNSGTIKNTRFKNINITIGAESAKYAGSIVGKNSGTIENCIIENCKFISNRYLGSCIVGSIAGQNVGTIKNCLCTGKYELGGKGNNVMSDPDGIRGYHFAENETGVSYSVFAASISKVGNQNSIDKGKVIAPEGTLSGSLYNTKRGDFSNLSVSIKGGTSTGTTWYYASDYLNGWPIQRVFLSWQYIEFLISPSAGGSFVGARSITLPSDVSGFSSMGAVTSLTLNDQTISINVNAGYKVTSWTWSSTAKVYTIKFEKLIYTVSFASVSYATPLGVGSYQVPHGNKISINYTPMKSGAYSKIVFTFEDTVGTQTVSYTVNNNKYYISGNTLTTSTSYTVKSNLTSIKVNTAIKTYGITIN